MLSYNLMLFSMMLLSTYLEAICSIWPCWLSYPIKYFFGFLFINYAKPKKHILYYSWYNILGNNHLSSFLMELPSPNILNLASAYSCSLCCKVFFGWNTLESQFGCTVFTGLFNILTVGSGGDDLCASSPVNVIRTGFFEEHGTRPLL